ncbi:NAT16 [Branchiostoma lanceolatum]|uniref:NAT16 protein n=2 Tax=Branchiostoma lanceolatum TaxID=7740 RepID=A0A8J9Z5N6_BRALA|nr:NAT16 [Branchiostoma lanceolatum]
MADNGASGKLTFRLASHGDYDAVMRISEGIYGGTDYLPAKFHSWIDNSDVTVFLATVGDQVVGLKASKVMESGTAFITKASRVAPNWTGQGIDRQLSLHLDTWMRQNHPTVKYKRSVTMSDSPRAESLKRKMHFIFNLPLAYYQCGPNLWWRQDPAQLAQLDTTGLPDVVPLQAADDDFCAAVQKWLPAEACGGHDGKPITLVDWDPYTLSPANLKRLQKQRALFTLKHNGESSLSIVASNPAPLGTQLCIDIYARDFPTWKKHVLKHLHDASIRFKSDHICAKMFVGLPELELDSVHDFCTDVLNMDKIKLSDTRMRADVFECEL